MKKILLCSLFCLIAIVLNSCGKTIARRTLLSDMVLSTQVVSNIPVPNWQNDLNDRFIDSFNNLGEWQDIAEEKIDSVSHAISQLHKNQEGFKTAIEENQKSISANKVGVENATKQLADVQQQQLNALETDTKTQKLSTENRNLALTNQANIRDATNQLTRIHQQILANQANIETTTKNIDNLEKNAKTRNEVINHILQREEVILKKLTKK